jgi:hypothetical protein
MVSLIFALLLLCAIGTAFFLPFALTLHLPSDSRLKSLAAALILKPYIVIPVWIYLSAKSTVSVWDALLALLPSVLFTLAIRLIHRDVGRYHKQARLLLSLESLHLIPLFFLPLSVSTDLIIALFAVVLFFPTLFAVIATKIVHETADQPRKVKEKAKYPEPPPPQLIQLADGEVVEVIDAHEDLEGPPDWT